MEFGTFATVDDAFEFLQVEFSGESSKDYLDDYEVCVVEVEDEV